MSIAFFELAFVGVSNLNRLIYQPPIGFYGYQTAGPTVELDKRLLIKLK